MTLPESSIIQLFEDMIVSFTGTCSAPLKAGYAHGLMEDPTSTCC